MAAFAQRRDDCLARLSTLGADAAASLRRELWLMRLGKRRRACEVAAWLPVAGKGVLPEKGEMAGTVAVRSLAFHRGHGGGLRFEARA